MVLKSVNTLKQLLMAHLEHNKRIEESTAAMRRYAFGLLLKVVGDIQITDFEYGQAELFQASLVDMNLASHSVNSYIKMTSPVFSWAVLHKIIPENPFRNLRKLKCKTKPIRILEDGEIQALLDSCPKLWQARCLLALTAGLRRGEILNLTLPDLDFKRGIIYVQGKDEGKDVWRWPVKNKDYRELPLTENLSRLLTEILLDLPDGQAYLMLTPKIYQARMRQKKAGTLSDRLRKKPDDNCYRNFEVILKRAGIRNATFHDLRRTAITKWLEAGLQPHEVQKLAGHASVETTMRYYVTTRRSLLDKARKALSNIGATGLEPATS